MVEQYATLIAEAENLCKKATPGPWMVCNNASLAAQHRLNINGKKQVRRVKIADLYQTTDLAVLGNDDAPNLKFICLSRELIPELIAAVKDLNEQLNRMTEQALKIG